MRKTAHVGHRARNAAPIPPQYLPLLALVAVLIGMQVATQIFAWKFAWHESLGEAVSALLSEKLPTPVRRIGVNDEYGHSGPADELLRDFGLKSDNIVRTVKEWK